MYKKIILPCIIFTFSLLTAQTGYVHDTGIMKFEMTDNGICGDDGTGSYSGLSFMGGENVIFSGGFGGAVNGYAFGNSGSYNLSYFQNKVPFSGFHSDSTFDQCVDFTTSGHPDYSVNINTYSQNNKSVLYIHGEVNFNGLNPVSQYLGLIIDFDIFN